MLEVKTLRVIKVVIAVPLLCMAIVLSFETLDKQISCAMSWRDRHQEQASQK